MFRNIVLGTYFWITMLITLLVYPVYHLLNLLSGKLASQFLMHGTRIWAKHLLFMAGIKMNVHGKKNIPESDKVCFISNHQSYLDIPVMDALVRKQLGFVAKKELNNVPVLNLWMPAMGCVLIDRKKPSKSLYKTRKRIEKIERGKPLFIFPEGTRSKNGKLGKFKTGSIGFLLQNHIWIVPVTINGTFRLLEKEKKIKKGTIDVHIHPPYFSSQVNMNHKEFAQKLESIIGNPL
jgi:1-acyl-sn-glycerol-3-phosphate acyltransferase